MLIHGRTFALLTLIPLFGLLTFTSIAKAENVVPEKKHSANLFRQRDLHDDMATQNYIFSVTEQRSLQARNQTRKITSGPALEGDVKRYLIFEVFGYLACLAFRQLRTPLVQYITCTVLVVDWEKGANGSYQDSAVNAPMAGVIISHFLQKIKNETKCAIHPDNITLIGFSLGAHVMGIAGRHFWNATQMLLGRISGLDPAGYLFDNETLGLSKNDAKYVDVIHTHAGVMEDFKLGINKQIGHVDFYPNNGSWQPGCDEYPSANNFTDSLTCSHYRAAYLYIESLTNHTCSFISYNCTDWEDYVNGTCRKNATEDKIGLMGYYSFTAKGKGTQYLATNEQSPFCRGNMTPPYRKPPENTFLSLLAKCGK